MYLYIVWVEHHCVGVHWNFFHNSVIRKASLKNCFYDITKRNEETKYETIWANNIPGRGNCKCKILLLEPTFPRKATIVQLRLKEQRRDLIELLSFHLKFYHCGMSHFSRGH